MKKGLKKIDLFGHEMRLNFNQKGGTHATYIGGFCSIFLYGFFIFFISLKAVTLLNRGDDKLGIMNVNADVEPVLIDIVWAHQITQYSSSQNYEIVSETEDSKKYVTFNYYFRVIDWYAWPDPYYRYVPIGLDVLTIDNIGPDFKEEYLESYDGIGPFYIPALDPSELILLAN